MYLSTQYEGPIDFAPLKDFYTLSRIPLIFIRKFLLSITYKTQRPVHRSLDSLPAGRQGLGEVPVLTEGRTEPIIV